MTYLVTFPMRMLTVIFSFSLFFFFFFFILLLLPFCSLRDIFSSRLASHIRMLRLGW
jgi:hypothetical protein